MGHTVRRPRELDDKADEKAKRKRTSEARKCLICLLGWDTHTLAERRACRAKARKGKGRVLP